jgi:hypothetical protein
MKSIWRFFTITPQKQLLDLCVWPQPAQKAPSFVATPQLLQKFKTGDIKKSHEGNSSVVLPFLASC